MSKLLKLLCLGALGCTATEDSRTDTITSVGDTALARRDTTAPRRPAAPVAASNAEPGSVPAVRTPSSADSTVPQTYFATMKNRAGKELGVLSVSDTGGTLVVMGRLAGLLPGVHAIHIHSNGRCTAPRFESAGSHWNPANKEHGLDNANGPHLGDLPNVTVGADSIVSILAKTRGGTLTGESPLLDVDGATIIIHASADDNRSQPSGASGDPVVCGVVVVR